MCLLPFTFSLLPFLVLCTLNSGGYRYGASDQAFYAPAVLARLDPTLFPRDRALIESQARLTFADEAIGALSRMTGAPVSVLFASLYVVGIALLAAAVWLLGGRFYTTPWATGALLAAMTLRHAISRSGTNTLEGYFHPRQVAFALGAMAIAGLLGDHLLVSAVCIAIGGLFHPTTALWFALWVAVATAVTDRRLRTPLLATAVLCAAAAVWALTRGPLAGRLAVMDPEWLATLDTKDYLFPLQWPLWVWLANLAYIPVIIVVYRRRAAAALTTARETGLVAGCLSLLIVFAAALPLNAAGVALAVQLQTPRVFWMLDFLATIYMVWALAEGASGTRQRAQLTAVIIACASLSRSVYIMRTHVPYRPPAQLDIAHDDWGRAMAWARTTASTTGWLADPLHAVKYGTSVRVAGRRDVLVEAVKDAAIGMYDRDVALRTRDRLAALGDFEALTAARGRALAQTYGLDYLVTDRRIELPVAFESGTLHVYRLR